MRDGRRESRAKSFISRRIFYLRNHSGMNYLETAGLLGHIQRDPKNHQVMSRVAASRVF
jgi:hypothetical protein